MKINKIIGMLISAVAFLCLAQPVKAQSVCYIGLTINYSTPFGVFQRYEISTVETDYSGCRETLGVLAENEFQTWNVFWVSGRAILVDSNGAYYYFSVQLGPR